MSCSKGQVKADFLASGPRPNARPFDQDEFILAAIRARGDLVDRKVGFLLNVIEPRFI